MIKFLIALLLVQAFYCAEFPDLEKHVKLTWNNVSLEGNFDGSQTVSDKNGNVDGFVLCAMYNNGANNGDCSYEYSYSERSPSGAIISDSGSGRFTTLFVSKDDNKHSCLKFYNPVAGFKEVYEATLANKGSWKVSYECKKSASDKDYTWIIVGVIVGVLVIVGAVFGVKYLKKKKSEKEGKTDGNNALLQNA